MILCYPGPDKLMDPYRWLPPEGVKIVLVLSLSFLIGLEREEHKTSVESYSFGGVRTFPLIGLIGYALAFLSGSQLLPLALGFAVVGGFLMLSYRHKLSNSGLAGVTSEMSGLATYLVGALFLTISSGSPPRSALPACCCWNSKPGWKA
jgi:hypothetical protein